MLSGLSACEVRESVNGPKLDGRSLAVFTFARRVKEA
jgi:hypothetical protein